MLRMEIKGSLKFPNMDLTKALDHVAEKIIIPEIAGHIWKETDIEGNSYPPLASSTLGVKDKKRQAQVFTKSGKMRKKFEGNLGLAKETINMGKKPLIDTGELFHSPYFVINPEKNKVVIGIEQSRKDVARYLQVEGIRTKSGKRYFNFFGISAIANLKAFNYIQSEKNKKLKGTSA